MARIPKYYTKQSALSASIRDHSAKMPPEWYQALASQSCEHAADEWPMRFFCCAGLLSSPGGPEGRTFLRARMFPIMSGGRGANNRGSDAAFDTIRERTEGMQMGERTEFDSGHTAPNDGWYMEIGDNDHIMGINEPRKIHLRKGEKFPEPSNHRRKWKRVKP
jgi:hypothetical protein